MKKKTTPVAVEVKKMTTTAQAYALIGAIAFFGFANFWGNLFDYQREVSAGATPTVYAASPTPSAQSLTLGLFQSGLSADQLTILVQQRQAALLKLAAANPAEAQAAVLDGAVTEQLPADIRAKLEQRVTAEGTLQVIHYDIDEERNLSRQEAFLLAGVKRQRLYHVDSDQLETLAGSMVKVHGFALDASTILLADTSSEAGIVPALEVVSPVATTTATTKKVGILLFNFQNDTRESISPSQARGVVFTDARSTNAYDQEVSHGQIRLEGKLQTTGDVFGWYTIPYDNAGCNEIEWTVAARTAATNAGVDLTGYDHIIYSFPPVACGANGWAEVNADESWINGGHFVFGTVTHEHGHNLNNWHAGTYACTDSAGQRTTISTTCTIAQYGDIFDVMGTSSYGRHFNNAHLKEVGWLPDANIQDVTTSGTYTLLPSQTDVSGVQAIRIPRNRDIAGNLTEYYWLEYRRPQGAFDNFSASDPVVNGISLRLAKAPAATQSYLSRHTLLLDTTATTSTFTDAALGLNQTMTDSAYGLTFTTTAVSPDQATVAISFSGPTCARNAPTVTLTPPSSIYGSSGQTLTYGLTVRNNDSAACLNATFTVTPTLPAGLTQAPASITVTLAPGAQSYTALSMTSALTAAAGSYVFSETAVNGASSQIGSASATYIVTGPDTIAPTLSLTPANGSTLKGKNIKVSANAGDSSGVTQITLSIDGVLKKTCTTVTTCAYTWSMTGVASGNHTITATASDPAGNVATVNNSVKK